MNIKLISLFSLLFVLSINAMSSFDQYENAREELKKCNNTYSSFFYGCNEQKIALDKEMNNILYPFNKIIEDTRDSNEILYYAERSRRNWIDPSISKEYLKTENIHGSNAIRYYIANKIKHNIESDGREANRSCHQIQLSHNCDECDDRSSIKEIIISNINQLKKFDHYPAAEHIVLLLHPRNHEIIKQVAEEMEKEIEHLKTKATL